MHRPHETEPGNWDAVLVAAGRGERLGQGVPKARAKLGGEALFLHSLRILIKHPGAGRVFLVTPPQAEEMEEMRLLLEGAVGAEHTSNIRFVPGGAERQDSVWSALRVLEECETSFSRLILIHDAARPLVTHPLIDRCLGAMEAPEEGGGQWELPGLARTGPWGHGPAAVVAGL